jgi:hypothetical protein
MEAALEQKHVMRNEMDRMEVVLGGKTEADSRTGRR